MNRHRIEKDGVVPTNLRTFLDNEDEMTCLGRSYLNLNAMHMMGGSCESHLIDHVCDEYDSNRMYVLFRRHKNTGEHGRGCHHSFGWRCASPLEAVLYSRFGIMVAMPRSTSVNYGSVEFVEGGVDRYELAMVKPKRKKGEPKPSSDELVPLESRFVIATYPIGGGPNLWYRENGAANWYLKGDDAKLWVELLRRAIDQAVRNGEEDNVTILGAGEVIAFGEKAARTSLRVKRKFLYKGIDSEHSVLAAVISGERTAKLIEPISMALSDGVSEASLPDNPIVFGACGGPNGTLHTNFGRRRGRGNCMVDGDATKKEDYWAALTSLLPEYSGFATNTKYNSGRVLAARLLVLVKNLGREAYIKLSSDGTIEETKFYPLQDLFLKLLAFADMDRAKHLRDQG